MRAILGAGCSRCRAVDLPPVRSRRRLSGPYKLLGGFVPERRRREDAREASAASWPGVAVAFGVTRLVVGGESEGDSCGSWEAPEAPVVSGSPPGRSESCP